MYILLLNGNCEKMVVSSVKKNCKTFVLFNIALIFMYTYFL